MMSKYKPVDFIDLSRLTQVFFLTLIISQLLFYLTVSPGSDCCQNLQSIQMLHKVWSVDYWWFMFVIFIMLH